MSRSGSSRRSALSQARITRGALYLLIASVGLSLLYLFGGDALQATLGRFVAASSDGIWREGKIWQLVTGPLLEPEFIGLVFQVFMLWMFLPSLERWWGTRRFLQFAAATAITGTAVGTLTGLFLGGAVITGLDPFIFAGIVAYGVLFANHPVYFFGVLPMTGKQLTIGIVGFMLLFVFLTQRWADGAANAAAMALAWGMTSGRIAPRLWYLKAKQRWLRRNLRVVQDRDRGRWMN